MQILLLRFDAPLCSFGAPIVDNLGVVQPFPALSMLTGLLANAIGYDHRQHEQLARLQARLRYASRCDRPGEVIRDFQTVDLGQEFLIDRNVAWTTRGQLELRGKGAATRGTHIRYRDYHADSIHTVALALSPPEELPDLDHVESAIAEPARPLFIGRKPCLPALPVLFDRIEALSPLEALCRTPRLPFARSGHPPDGQVPAWWFSDEQGDWVPSDSQLLAVTDERDWNNQVHGGHRWMRHGLIDPPEEANNEG